MQIVCIGDNLYENVNLYFLKKRKEKKNITSMSSAEFSQRDNG